MPEESTTPASNDDQANYWTAVGGPQWVAEQRQFDSMLAPFGAEAIRILDPRPGERIIDSGCGTGTMTRSLADAVGPTGEVIGVDISPTMIDAAGRRFADVAHLSFSVGDAQTDALDASGVGFDAVFSRFGVMFFADPVAAFANIVRAVRPGGRLAFVCWRAESLNDWVAVPARVMRSFTPEPLALAGNVPGPFAFQDGERVHAILDLTGWTNIHIEGFTADTMLGSGDSLDSAVAHAMGNRVGVALRAQVDDATFAAATDAVRAALSEHLVGNSVIVPGNVWVVTADRPAG